MCSSSHRKLRQRVAGGKLDVVADSTGTTVWRNDNTEPFGDSVADENPSGLGVFEFPLGFPGQYCDTETLLCDNWYRSYDRRVGRYAQSDPIGLDGGLNTYAYVRDNPIGASDPPGLFLAPAAAAAAAAWGMIGVVRIY